MNIDDRARQAGAALSARAGEIDPHRPGLGRKPWVAPVGAVAGVVAAILLVAVAVNGLGSDGSSELETISSVDESVELVDGIRGPIVAGFVSASGEITVWTGEALSPTVERLTVNAGAPVLGVETIPEPRWSFDGRVIEYVSGSGDDLRVVRVDVRTGRTTTEPYWVEVEPGGGTSTSPEDGAVLTGRIMLMSGAEGPSVSAFEDEAGSQWRVNLFSGDRILLFDIGSTRFLAPTPEGLLMVADGVLSTMRASGNMSELGPAGVSGETVNAAGTGPRGEYAFGLLDGSVVIATFENFWSFELDRDGAVTGLSWDPSGETLIAQTTDRDRVSLHLCVIAATTCSKIETVNATSGSLVRGIPAPLPPEMFFGIWPESTRGAADQAARAGDAEQWRFDAESLTAEFAKVVLGWPDPLVVEADQIASIPYSTTFEVRPSLEQPTVTVTASQIAGESGWVITGVSSPIRSIRSGDFPPGAITIGFDRHGATTVDVTISLGEAEYSQSTDDLDEVEFLVEAPAAPGYFLILFRNEDAKVFAAYSGDLLGSVQFFSIG